MNFINFVPLDSLNTIEIDALVNKVKSGDASAFSEVYDRYSGALNGVVMRLIGEQEIANDVLQDSFVKIWKNIESYDKTKGSFYTWMLNIARNTSIDHLRKSKKELKSEIQDWDVSVGTQNAVVQNTSTIGLTKLVENLAPEQQVIIEYLYFKGYTQQEISDELELPLGTVKTRTRLAMRELRKYFTIFIFWI